MRKLQRHQAHPPARTARAHLAEQEVWVDEVGGQEAGAGGAVALVRQVLLQATVAEGVACGAGERRRTAAIKRQAWCGARRQPAVAAATAAAAAAAIPERPRTACGDERVLQRLQADGAAQVLLGAGAVEEGVLAARGGHLGRLPALHPPQRRVTAVTRRSAGAGTVARTCLFCSRRQERCGVGGRPSKSMTGRWRGRQINWVAARVAHEGARPAAAASHACRPRCAQDAGSSPQEMQLAWKAELA